MVNGPTQSRSSGQKWPDQALIRPFFSCVEVVSTDTSQYGLDEVLVIQADAENIF